MLKRPRLIVATLAAAMLCGASWLHQEQKTGKSVTVDIIDIAKTDDLPMIKVTINGKQGIFLIDTGQVAEGTTITPAFAKQCGLTKNEEKVTLAVGEGDNAIVSKDFPVVVLNRGVEKQGILGATFFERLRLTVDYAESKATFSTYDVPFEPPEGARKSAMTFLKMRTRPIKGAYMKATVGDKEFFVCVDTGANWSSINTDAFDRVFPTPETQTLYGVKYKVGTGMLKLGDIEIPNAPFARLTNQGVAMTERATGTRVDGLVGTNILRRYTVTFDYDKKELWFSPPKKSK